jgi:Bacterial Ig-like domain
MMRSHTLKGRIGHVHQCSFDFAAGATQTDISQFQNAVNIVVGYFESVFTNVNVTLNVKFAYGEKYAGNPGGSLITYTPMANATSTGTFALGASTEQYTSYNYTTVRNQLLTESDTLQSSAYSTLPTTSPFPSNDTLWVSSAEQRAIGLPPTNTNGSTLGDTIGGFDGVVGIISNEELAAGGYTADWTKSAPANSKQYYMLGTIEHEHSSRPGETDIMMRNVNTGDFEIVDCLGNNLIGATYSIGTADLDMKVVGFGPMNSLGSSSMMLRNVNTGALDIYDISNNQLTNDTELGADYSGLDWQIGGFADTVTPTVTVSIDNTDVNVSKPTGTVTFTFSEAPNSFTLADTSTIGGTLANLQQVDATHYTATFTGTPGTNISNAVVSVAAGSWQESWGNFGTGGSTASFTVDTIAPQVRMAIDNSDLNLARPTGTVTFLFSQAPVSFTLANTTVSGGTLSNLQLVGSTFGLTEYTATFTAAANTDTGSAVVSVAAGSWHEADGNLGTAGSTGSFTVDTVAPTVAVATDNTFVNQAHTIGKITFAFSEAPTTFALADITATGDALSNLQEVDATHYTATFSGSANTQITNASVGVIAGSWQENNGNLGAGGSTAPFRVDMVTPPSPPTISVSNDPTAARGQVIALSALVSISDPFGVAFQKLELWDSNGTATGGQFVVNGVPQTAGHEIDVAPTDLAKTVFDVGIRRGHLVGTGQTPSP